jgi:hypothetical protein
MKRATINTNEKGTAMSLKTGLVAAFLGTALFGMTGSAQAQSYQHIHRLALQLERQTAEMHREVHLHFRRTPDYVHLDRDVAEMERLARHIHDVVDQRGSVRHLRADVERLDHLFHHIEDVIGRLARTRQIGPQALSHFRGVMGEVGGTLHHLRDDLSRMRDVDHDHGHPGHRPGGLNIPRFGLQIRW